MDISAEQNEAKENCLQKVNNFSTQNRTLIQLSTKKLGTIFIKI